MSTPARVGDVIDVVVERPATGGAVGRVDGFVTFVRSALPGERVRATVTEVARSYQRADAHEIVEASADRVHPPCPYAAANECGGCDLQHATEAAQRAWKSTIASEHLRRIARISRELDVADAGPAEGSRSRLRCGVVEGRIGLHRARSHEIVPLDRCWIADRRLEPAFAAEWADAVSVELRAIGSGDPFAVVTTEDRRIDLRSLDGSALAAAVSTTEVLGVAFRVSAQSFWQSHRRAPAMLAARVTAHVAASPRGDVIDLYGGVGLFGVTVAHADERRSVTIVEHNTLACDDARFNASALASVQVVEAPVSSRTVREIVHKGDVVVVDPPRNGIASSALDAITAMRPSRVVYVSCDAATLARDLSRFMVAGYRLRDIEAFDLFPMTEHLELIAILDDGVR